jgi:hypothetical protein
MSFFLGVLVGYVGVMVTMLFVFALTAAAARNDRAIDKSRLEKSSSKDIDQKWYSVYKDQVRRDEGDKW